jgi:hypothetical protein
VSEDGSEVAPALCVWFTIDALQSPARPLFRCMTAQQIGRMLYNLMLAGLVFVRFVIE